VTIPDTIRDVTRRPARALAALSLAGALGAAGCNDFLTGGELDTDPNNPAVATNRQLFVGVTSGIWTLLGSDPARTAGLLVQQFQGGQSQYYNTYTYQIDENTTNGFHTALYTGGGLRDVRQLQANARAQGDTLFLGIAQVQEALLIGTGADLFGDLVYTQALTGTPNPPLDKQLAIYDSVQTLLSRAITNLQSWRGTATNLGPGTSDLNYGGNKDRWTRLARTLKARFFLHTAEVRGQAAYQSALAEARQGITNPAENYTAFFSGSAGEENFYFQFTLVQRFGYLIPDPGFVALLQSRGDPRLEEYFDTTGDVCGEPFFCLSYYGDGSGFAEEGHDMPLVTAQENLLIWAEAAQRTGATAEAVTQLNRARTIAGLPAVPATLSGTALLREILTEKYIALFGTIEPWNDYRRTCFPNLRPTVQGQKITARLLYDAGERQTNTSIPGAQSQPTRNQNDPANTTSIDGTACLGQ
jgi:starch-binding outer membrane protein, SusD/RagB family